MKFIRDNTGRFKQRPWYELRELDQECEQVVNDFMNERFGGMRLPIPTDAFTKLIERDAADLDLYADLAKEGSNVQGLTYFYPGKKPSVLVSKELSEEAWQSHRLRTTLTHEYGHVRFHGCLYELQGVTENMFPEEAYQNSPKCKRETIVDASMTDWIEWQAGYICGALLMPIGLLKKLIAEFCQQYKIQPPLKLNAAVTEQLKIRIVRAFNVSSDAAQIRLLKLGYFADPKAGPGLFE